MTYRYAMNGSNHATVFRQTDGGELVAEAEIDGRNLTNPGDIRAIARATVAALNGTTAEPRVVWNPVVVNALRAARDYPDGLARNQLALGQIAREALALVDQPAPAEKVVGYGLMTIHDSSRIEYATQFIFPTAEKARNYWKLPTVVRLVEEPAP